VANPIALDFGPNLEKIRQIIPDDTQVFLVGGAVRDALKRKPIRDYDFVVMEDVFDLARHVADKLGGAFFVMDDEREIARVIKSGNSTYPEVYDFSKIVGGTLEADLRNRDFTINAIAVNVQRPQEVLDPLGGANDLLHGKLKECSASAVINDPIRVLRAIRIAVDYKLRISSETRKKIKLAGPSLNSITDERIRDELFKIFDGLNPKNAINALDRLGVLEIILPELTALKDIKGSYPQHENVWGHTLSTLGELQKILAVLQPKHDVTLSSNLIQGLGVTKLRKHLGRIAEHINSGVNHSLSNRSLLFFAALYHDVGKTKIEIDEMEGDKERHFHSEVGSDLIGSRGRKLRLSNSEVNRLKTIVLFHMKPAQLSKEIDGISPRRIYRFFRETGSAGIDICLLSLADIVATYGTELSQDRWSMQLEAVNTLMDAWWDNYKEYIDPPKLVSGKDLLQRFGIKPGPRIGYYLELVREYQVMGRINTREDAFRTLDKQINHE
jgi:tRNA nucleotidyltransferase/poly(A) polymerase